MIEAKKKFLRHVRGQIEQTARDHGVTVTRDDLDMMESHIGQIVGLRAREIAESRSVEPVNSGSPDGHELTETGWQES